MKNQIQDNCTVNFLSGFVKVKFYLWGIFGGLCGLLLQPLGAARIAEPPQRYAWSSSWHIADSVVQRIRDSLDRLHINGNMLFGVGDSVLFEKYEGYINFKTREKINPQTPFHLASTTKTFTAMAIMKLYQDSALDIFAPVSTYFPDFPYKNITISHLLSHRSGLNYYAFFLSRKRGAKIYTNQDVLDYLIKYRPRLEFTPNSRFKYCNTNYVLLALLVEKISQKTFETYLKETFFTPYHMDHTFVLDRPEKRAFITPSYSYRKRYLYGFSSLDLIYGDKNMYSTARDLFKWNQALEDTTLFKKNTLALAYNIFSPLYDKKTTKGYGLGWRIVYTNDDHKAVYHNGWWHGNKSCFVRVPDLHISIIGMNNVSSSSVYALFSLLRYMIPKMSPIEDEEPTIITETEIRPETDSLPHS